MDFKNSSQNRKRSQVPKNSADLKRFTNSNNLTSSKKCSELENSSRVSRI